MPLSPYGKEEGKALLKLFDGLKGELKEKPLPFRPPAALRHTQADDVAH